jgi:glycosyltransferase involved in cell wall biosynthesis
MGLNKKLLLVGRMGWNSDKELNGLLEVLGDKVLFTGYVTNEELSVLYSNCDYFLLMYLY